MMPVLPFRLGSTSYVIPADILPNVRFLAPLVDDVELVLFQVDDQSNLPTPAVTRELGRLAQEHDLTYTVHLPLDLDLACDAAERRDLSITKAREVIQAMRALHPWAYVVHLDGQDIQQGLGSAALSRWRDRAIHSLVQLGREAGEPHLLAIENLESYDPAALAPLLEQLPVSLCVDAGHLLKMDQDPLPFLEAHLDRTRVVHLHGARDGRDHRALDLIPTNVLTGLVDLLLDRRFGGVLTLEIFSERHFLSGRQLLLETVAQRTPDAFAGRRTASPGRAP